ncbi:hypothetical protein PRUPE_8G101600 [Prunus persica]|uniref:Uncharacterized protein n=1 Tax=Prunus persica TaxID=3760 RepID=M5W748_PRUPE|nr:hypothetical protein PRUPE_8G101600 [Prunus persica]
MMKPSQRKHKEKHKLCFFHRKHVIDSLPKSTKPTSLSNCQQTSLGATSHDLEQRWVFWRGSKSTPRATIFLWTLLHTLTWRKPIWICSRPMMLQGMRWAVA